MAADLDVAPHVDEAPRQADAVHDQQPVPAFVVRRDFGAGRRVGGQRIQHPNPATGHRLVQQDLGRFDQIRVLSHAR